MIELGDELLTQHRAAPTTEQVAAYIGAENLGEFSAHARAVGQAGIVVPGPMLAAFLDQFLRQQLSGWRIERLHITFRVPTLAGTELAIRGVVTEHHEMADGERLVCDLVIEHGEGDRAATGSATLLRGAVSP